MRVDRKPFAFSRFLVPQYLGNRSVFIGLVVSTSVILFAVMMSNNLHKLGIYPDAINNDYIAVRILHPSRQSFAVVLPGNLIWSCLPVLAGGIYYGSLQAYLAVPFIIFGSSVATFVFSHFVLGALLLLVVFSFVAWASKCTPIAVCAVALMAARPSLYFYLAHPGLYHDIPGDLRPSRSLAHSQGR